MAMIPPPSRTFRENKQVEHMKADALGAEKEATLKCIEPTLKSGMVFVFFNGKRCGSS